MSEIKEPCEGCDRWKACQRNKKCWKAFSDGGELRSTEEIRKDGQALLSSWLADASLELQWAFYNHAIVNRAMRQAAIGGLSTEAMLWRLSSVQSIQNREFNEKILRAQERGFRF